MILAEHPEQDTVMYTAFPTRDLLDAAAMLGVRDVVTKSELPRLIEVLRRPFDSSSPMH